MPKIRLFIDPASYSTGWALFKDDELLKSGTVAVKDKDLATRMHILSYRYSHLFHGKTVIDCSEVHIEQWGGRIAYQVPASMGAIMAGVYNICPNVKQDIPVSSWQSWCKWHEMDLKKECKDAKVESEDELAAILMGKWYLEVKVNEC